VFITVIQGSYRSGKTGKGQGILVVRESQGNATVTGKSGKFEGKFYVFFTVVVMLIIVELESNPPYC